MRLLIGRVFFETKSFCSVFKNYRKDYCLMITITLQPWLSFEVMCKNWLSFEMSLVPHEGFWGCSLIVTVMISSQCAYSLLWCGVHLSIKALEGALYVATVSKGYWIYTLFLSTLNIMGPIYWSYFSLVICIAWHVFPKGCTQRYGIWECIYDVCGILI